MAGKAEYRSSKRSKQLIKKAVAGLMVEKDISKITVQEIAARADINRGTFYAHYRDTYDVLEQIENEYVTALKTLLDEFSRRGLVRTPRDLMLAISAYLEQDLEFNQLLFRSRSANTFLLKFRRVIAQYIMTDQTLLLRVKNKTELQLCASYIAAGGVGLIQDWFNGDMTIPLRNLAGVTDRLVTQGMESFFHPGDQFEPDSHQKRHPTRLESGTG